MDTETIASDSDVTRTIGHDPEQPAPWKRWAKWAILAIVVAGALFFFFGRSGTKATTYTTQEVTRGDLRVTVTATGNLEPRNQVDVGSELSGQVRSVLVDVNDQVKMGQVLAVLDTTRLKAQVAQAESSLASAEARVLQSDASAKESRANYQRLLKVRELSGGKLPSQQDMDVAEAQVARAEGDTAAAKASVAQSRANLEAVRNDLSKTEVRSPINGVVLVRSVEPGQTVAATMTAPVLFTLAEDLEKMELHVSVDEADVGSVLIDQAASFTVDAYQNRRFNARITKVHLASNNTQKSSGSANAASATSTGVVTYETVLEVDNSDQLLRPGMTATAEIVTTSIENATLIPNAALRFTPEGQQFTGFPGGQQGGNPLNMLMPIQGNNNNRRFNNNNFGGGNNNNRGQGGALRRMGRAWIMENGKPALVMFRPGPTDGRMTQVLDLEGMPNFIRQDDPMAEEFRKAMSRKLEPGSQVITDSETKTK
jgi:HlyD family secretion protein